MLLAVCFTNFGPYHLARLRSLADRLQEQGSSLVAYEVASHELTYPWERSRKAEPFEWITLFPNRTLETLSHHDCTRAFTQVLDRDRPDALGVVGYVHPESVAGALWARRNRRPVVLMSESQRIDRIRSWWKERVKRQRLGLFDAALVGGPTHRDYLIDLGMPEDRISFGYNAVDNLYYQTKAKSWRELPHGTHGLPRAPFFLSVCRFVREKNLVHLIDAFVRYREQASLADCWDLVLCGNGPEQSMILDKIANTSHADAIHVPGFLQANELARWYAYASAFVLPSISEPWGLVVNEAASTGLPLLVSERAGCAKTLVPSPQGSTGAQFDPLNVKEMTSRLAWLSMLPDYERQAIGQRAAQLVNLWGPERFAEGMLDAIALASQLRRVSRLRRPSSQKVEMKP